MWINIYWEITFMTCFQQDLATELTQASIVLDDWYYSDGHLFIKTLSLHDPFCWKPFWNTFGLKISSSIFWELFSSFFVKFCTIIFCITTLNVNSMSPSVFWSFWVYVSPFSLELFDFLWNFSQLILTILWWSQE